MQLKFNIKLQRNFQMKKKFRIYFGNITKEKWNILTK